MYHRLTISVLRNLSPSDLIVTGRPHPRRQTKEWHELLTLAEANILTCNTNEDTSKEDIQVEKLQVEESYRGTDTADSPIRTVR